MTYVVRNGHRRNSSVATDFDRLFNSVFNESGAWWNAQYPRVDVRETADAYIIEAELPGLTQDDVDVHVEDDRLTLSSVEKENMAESDTGEKYVVRERRYGAFKRAFSLPRDADRNKIEARFQNGILILEIQKREDAKPRSIEISGE